jgi:hypothetical protein
MHHADRLGGRSAGKSLRIPRIDDDFEALRFPLDRSCALPRELLIVAKQIN